MALTLGQLTSGAGAVSVGMRRAEAQQQDLRQNQLILEERNRLEEARQQRAAAQAAGLRLPEVTQMAGVPQRQQFAAPGLATASTATAPMVAPTAPSTAPRVQAPAITPSLTSPLPTGVSDGFPTETMQSPEELDRMRQFSSVRNIPQDTEAIGLEFDAATAEYNKALAKLNTYGGRKQAADPTGFRQVQEEFARARQARDQAQAKWEQAVSPYTRPVQTMPRPPVPTGASVSLAPEPTPSAPVVPPTAGVKEPTIAAPAAPVTAAEPTAPVTGQPRSVRNNNPGNLIFNEYTRGLGATGQDKDGFAIFPTPQAGQTAAVSNLQNYGQRGINTVGAVINRWAPPNAPGNTPLSTANYTAYVASKLGVSPDQPLNMNDPKVLNTMATAISEFESGQGTNLVATNAKQTADQVAQIAAPKTQARTGLMTQLPQDFRAINQGTQMAVAARQALLAEADSYYRMGMNREAAALFMQVSAIDTGLFKAQGDLGVYELAASGDPSRAMAVVSQFTGIPHQALDRGDGTYDLYMNGRVAQTGVPVDKLADLIRTQIDDGYRQQKASLNAKVFEKDLDLRNKIQEELVKAQGNIQKALVEGKFKILEKEAEKRGGKLTVDTSSQIAYLQTAEGQVLIIDPRATETVRGKPVSSPTARPVSGLNFSSFQ